MNDELIMEMIHYYTGDPQQIQHFLKVMTFSDLIAKEEKMSEKERFILEAAAIVHDIGIKKSKEIYGDSLGKHQEELGPDIANNMLRKLNYDLDIIERVCYLVGHHHTYDHIQRLDYQILVEADFLVNLYEDNESENAIRSVREKIFKTASGTKMLDEMFLTNE